MQTKTTRAFRTISEAGEELDLQPHVLRFWESKFPQIKPIKRGGGRRFYRPEDIELLRGIKILLHDEGHPIKDVQKLMRLKGPARIIELGQSVEKAATERKVEDTVLVPERIKKRKPVISKPKSEPSLNQKPKIKSAEQPAAPIMPALEREEIVTTAETSIETQPGPSEEVLQHKQDLEDALERLKSLKSRWGQFKAKA